MGKTRVHPISVKIRAGLPVFSKDGYLGVISAAAIEDKVPPFELFSQFDEEKLFRCTISGV